MTIRKMKETETEWLKKIPSAWQISKIGSFYSLRNEKVSDKKYDALSVTKKGVVPQLETAAKTNYGDNRKLVKKGDFVINSRSDRRGSCGISNYDGSVSLINTIMIPRKKINSEYYNWLFHTVEFGDEFYKWGHGIVDDLWTTNWQDMKKIIIPVPNVREQGKIAKFLNLKCNKIDKLIKNINEEIEVLDKYKISLVSEIVTLGLNKNVQLKETSIPWAKKIPKNWQIMPNKYLMKKIKNICSFYNGEKILSLTVNGVINRDLNLGGKMPTSFNGYQFVEPNNLLMCLFDIDVTPRCIGLIKQKGVTSPAYSQFKLSNIANERYYYYYYLMLDYTKELLHLAKNLRHSLTEDQLGMINQIVPPLSEQEEIADYLDSKFEKINSIINLKEEEIKVLENYKNNLIYEYTTGKKEVPINE